MPEVGKTGDGADQLNGGAPPLATKVKVCPGIAVEEIGEQTTGFSTGAGAPPPPPDEGDPPPPPPDGSGAGADAGAGGGGGGKGTAAAPVISRARVT